MGFIVRGIKNAFRNIIRTFSITLILAISIALALIMLLSLKAVQTRIDSVKSNIGNIITVSPAGAQGFEGGGTPLTETIIAPIKTLLHVTKITETLNDRLTPTTDTSLASAIDPGTLGNRAGRGFGGNATNPNGTPRTFTVPIRVNSTSDLTTLSSVGSSQLTVKSGAFFDTTVDQAVALVGSGLATKNNLSVGSTFTAYSTTFKVSGIYEAGNTFANAGLILPIKTLQRLSNQTGQISSAIVQVDSISNISTAVNEIKTKLGANVADVVSQQDTSNQALAPLESIKNVALYSLFGALAAGSVIIFLTMLMIVRERRREIGVLKAIGAPNNKIMLQFITESLTLTILGGVIGFLGGLFFSNPVLSILINNSSANPTPSGGQGFRNFANFGSGINGARSALTSLHTVIGYDLLLYGVIAIVLIAIIGSAIPSLLISRVRPAEVLRSDS